MLTLGYDEELAHKVYKEEGEECGRVRTLLEFVRDGILTRQEAIERSGFSVKDFESIEEYLQD